MQKFKKIAKKCKNLKKVMEMEWHDKANIIAYKFKHYGKLQYIHSFDS